MNNQAVEILQSAYNQVSDVLNKADQTANMLTEQVAKIKDQKLGLSAQKQMLAELIVKINKLTSEVTVNE